MVEVFACAGCGEWLRATLFDMGIQPLAEGGDAGRYPLKLMKCDNCGLVQLSHNVAQDVVFKKDHPYSTGNSKTLRLHFAQLADSLTLDPYGNFTAVDIGANDGTLLDALNGRWKRIAVEPTNQILKCSPDIIRYQKFFTYDLATNIHSAHGPADLITATNVLAHVPDVQNFLRGVRALLRPGGEFITENHSLASITEGAQFDTIYHEHLRYYTIGTLSFLLEKAGFRVISAEPVDTHGGSFRIRASVRPSQFPGNVVRASTALRATMYELSGAAKEPLHRTPIYGIGATTRATPLIFYSGIQDFITCVCEVPGSDKIGTKMPGTQIPVVDEQKLIDDQPPYALLLSWHMADDIIPALRAKGYKGKFIVPLPKVKVLGDG